MPKETFFNLPQEKQQRIVDSAIEEFGKHSYEEASISRIVARAGIAKGSFYQYFENKKDLYEYLVFNVIGKAKFEFMQNYPPAARGDFFSSIGNLARAGLAFGLSHPQYSMASKWVWYPSGHPDLHSVFNRLRTLGTANLIQLLEQGISAGHLREDLDLEATANLLITVINHSLDNLIRVKLGVSLIEFCSHPELAERFPENEQQEEIDKIISIIRPGLANPSPPCPSASMETPPPRLDLSRLKIEAAPPKGDK